MECAQASRSLINELMKHVAMSILQSLKDTYTEIKEIKQLIAQNKGAEPERLLNKIDVMTRLQISDSTYRRYVKAGRLKPMRLHGIDMYTERDIRRELEESRRKGRL